MLRTSREYTRAGDSLISESALWYARGVSAPSGAELVPPSPPTQRERVRGGVSGGVKYIVLQEARSVFWLCVLPRLAWSA